MSKHNPLLSPLFSEKQLALRDQLVDYNAAALELSSRINALSLPCKLPFEILSQVFLTFATLVHEADLKWTLGTPAVLATRSFYKWIYVSHVCRYWREVALSCAPLWSFLVFETYSVTEGMHRELLARAGTCPLTVIYHQNSDSNCERCVSAWYTDFIGLDYIADLLPRIRDLVLIIETEGSTDELWETLSEPAESLEFLNIGIRGEAWQNNTHLDGPGWFKVPDGLFSRQTPRLQTLDVERVTCFWTNSLFCSSLRHLRIESCTTSGMSMPAFLSMLSSMPLLEALATDSLPEVRHVETVASLPLLRHLRISGYVNDIAFVLAHLQLPIYTSITLTLSRDGIAGEVSALAHTLSSIIRQTPLHTVLYRADPTSFNERQPSHFHGWSGPITDISRLWDPKTDISPRLALTLEDDMSALLRELDFSHLSALYVNGPLPSTRPWGDWFGSAPNLSLLRVSGRSGYLLGTSLSMRVPTMNQGQDGEERLGRDDAETLTTGVVMPRLRLLQLVRVKFPPPRKPKDFKERLTRRQCWCDNCELIYGLWGKRGLDVQDLVKGLRRRRELGAAEVELIEFLDCPHMRISHLRPLMRDGAMVVFDGVVCPRLR